MSEKSKLREGEVSSAEQTGVQLTLGTMSEAVRNALQIKVREGDLTGIDADDIGFQTSLSVFSGQIDSMEAMTIFAEVQSEVEKLGIQDVKWTDEAGLILWDVATEGGTVQKAAQEVLDEIQK